MPDRLYPSSEVILTAMRDRETEKKRERERERELERWVDRKE